MEHLPIKIKGHVLIKDKDTGEILLDQDNAVHPRNAAIALARLLAAENNGAVYVLALGNGGSNVTATDVVEYNDPFDNDYTETARLYNTTYWEVVDDSTSAPDGNSVSFNNTMDGDNAIVTVTLELSAGEPTGQDVSDSGDFNNVYAFDELGLFTDAQPTPWPTWVDPQPAIPEKALMLTHIVFSPILKTTNRAIIITYTLTIALDAS